MEREIFKRKIGVGLRPTPRNDIILPPFKGMIIIGGMTSQKVAVL